jgi:hypothetical protein
MTQMEIWFWAAHAIFDLMVSIALLWLGWNRSDLKTLRQSVSEMTQRAINDRMAATERDFKIRMRGLMKSMDGLKERIDEEREDMDTLINRGMDERVKTIQQIERIKQWSLENFATKKELDGVKR